MSFKGRHHAYDRIKKEVGILGFSRSKIDIFGMFRASVNDSLNHFRGIKGSDVNDSLAMIRRWIIDLYTFGKSV